MSSDRPGDDRPVDGDLLDQLRAFGQTLGHHSDEPIRAADASASAPPDTPPTVRPDVSPAPAAHGVGRGNRTAWLAIAALLLAAAGFGLGRLWPDGIGSIDSTGSPDGGAETRAGQESDDADRVDEQGQPTEDGDGETTEPTSAVPLPPEPTLINAADGTALSVVDDVGPLATGPEPALVDHGDVVARAVLVELVRLQLFGSATRDEVADHLLTDGLTITTTFDPTAATSAQAAITVLHPEGDRSDEVAIVTIDNRTGAIVALASSEPTSVLVDGARQPGSAFKPMVLASLFEQGYHPNDLVSGSGPCSFAIPEDQGGGTYVVGGREQVRQSIAAVTRSSNNCAFARLGQAAGLDRVATMAQDLGLSTLPDEAGEFLSLPLGVTSVNGVELAGAYATFANDGVHRTPWVVAEVIDRNGEVLYRHDQDADAGRRVMSAESAAQMTAVLESNVVSGTGRRAQLSEGHWSAGKTGTTEGATDAWFAGYTSAYTTVVWVGDPSETPEEIRIPDWSHFGGALPATIWGRYNDELHRDLAVVPLPEAPDLAGREVRVVEAENEVFDG